jgi:RimJ/RimL family protein N-acetyltransferase
MELQISPFRAISDQGQKDIVNLIKIGNEANAELILERLENSLVTAWLQLENRIVGTATIKRPEVAYRTYVFGQAALNFPPETITLELGYIFIDSEFRKQGYTWQMCHALINLISEQTVFATTRTDNLGMKAILQKLHFISEGNTYENRSKTKFLQLYVRKPFTA